MDYIPLARAPLIRYAVSMKSPPQNDIIHLKEPLFILKELDIDFLGMVDTGMVQLWPLIVHLCEKENLSLQEATEQMVKLDPLRLGMPEWYLYKMRSLLRAHFVGDDIQPRNVIIHATEGRKVSFTVYERRSLGQYLLAHVLLNR